MLVNKTIIRQGIYAVFFGIFTGIFFGSWTVEFLKPIANAFSMFLQMAVFPYICISLIYGLLSIEAKNRLQLFKQGVPFVLGLWAIALFLVFFLAQIVPEPFPPFYFAKMGDRGGDSYELLVESLIPENGINALANNQILAGLAFSLFFGAALRALENKEFMIPYLERSLQILEQIFEWLCRLSPIGIFSYIAIAFGSIELEDILGIKYYLIGFIFISLFFSILIIPSIISNFSEKSKNQIFKEIRNVCLLPFLCGSPSLLLPFLVLHRESSASKSPSRLLVIPIAYCISQVGSSVVIFVLSFLSFYYRFSMSVVEQIRMALLFAPVSGSFFLSHFNLPIPATQIDEEAMLINHHFLVLMSAVSVLAVVVWMQEKKQVRWKSLFSSLSLYSLLFISVVYIAKPFIHMDDYYKGIYQNRKIADVITDPVQAIRIFPGETGTPRDPAKPTLQQIIETGVLKVGVEEYEAPFCYLNNSNEFAGYDIAYAYQLARDLDCSLEFVRVDLDRLSEQLLAGEFDVGMSSFVMTENRLKTIQFTQPSYQEEDNVLIIPRSRKNEFMDLNNIRALDLKILTRGVYKGIAEKYFSKATILSGQDLSLLKNREVDACFWARTSGFIWCILNPEFIVMDYGPSLGKAYIAYPFRENAFAFASFMNNWLKVKEQVGFKKKMREYWIQGLPPERRPSRWSILKDMLHLVE